MKPEQVSELVKLPLEWARATLGDACFLRSGGRTPQSVINRAYYAMFYAALALLQTTGEIPTKHTGVIGLFDTEFVLKGAFPKNLSMDFHHAFEARQIPDYQDSDVLRLICCWQSSHALGRIRVPFIACHARILGIRWQQFGIPSAQNVKRSSSEQQGKMLQVAIRDADRIWI